MSGTKKLPRETHDEVEANKSRVHEVGRLPYNPDSFKVSDLRRVIREVKTDIAERAPTP